jgi:hypothetical protein
MSAQYSISANNTDLSFSAAWTDPTDPMDHILHSMQEIAFRIGLEAGKNTSHPNSTQQLEYSRQHQQTVYRTEHRFTVAAAENQSAVWRDELRVSPGGLVCGS